MKFNTGVIFGALLRGLLKSVSVNIADKNSNT